MNKVSIFSETQFVLFFLKVLNTSLDNQFEMSISRAQNKF